MKVAILGGTGSFGRALAARLVAAGEDEIAIGSRDDARAKAAAAELGPSVTGGTNDRAVAGVDLVVLAVKADAALDTAREVAAALGETPLLSVASDLTFTSGGVHPDPDARSLAERVQELVAGAVVAGLHSIASVEPRVTSRPRRTRSSAATILPRRSLRSSSCRGSLPAAPSTPARSRAPARSRG